MRPTRLATIAAFTTLTVLSACQAPPPSAPQGSQSSVRQSCAVVGSSTAGVLPGVTLTHGSSFLCANAPDSGTYTLTVEVSISAAGDESITLDTLTLAGTTPLPLGQAPSATGTATGLPVTLTPDSSATIVVSGSYELAVTDEGKRTNLHFHVNGSDGAGEALRLGVNAMFRAPGVTP